MGPTRNPPKGPLPTAARTLPPVSFRPASRVSMCCVPSAVGRSVGGIDAGREPGLRHQTGHFPGLTGSPEKWWGRQNVPLER